MQVVVCAGAAGGVGRGHAHRRRLGAGLLPEDGVDGGPGAGAADAGQAPAGGIGRGTGGLCDPFSSEPKRKTHVQVYYSITIFF